MELNLKIKNLSSLRRKICENVCFNYNAIKTPITTGLGIKWQLVI